MPLVICLCDVGEKVAGSLILTLIQAVFLNLVLPGSPEHEGVMGTGPTQSQERLHYDFQVYFLHCEKPVGRRGKGPTSTDLQHKFCFISSALLITQVIAGWLKYFNMSPRPKLRIEFKLLWIVDKKLFLGDPSLPVYQSLSLSTSLLVTSQKY